MDFLLELDREVFLFLNSLGRKWLDPLMTLLSNKYVWIPLYLWMIYSLKVKWKSKWLISILMLIVLVVLADQVSASILKPLIERLRPCKEPLLLDQIRLVGGCGGKYGFVSSHAANTFGLAVLYYLLAGHGWFRMMVIGWAVLVGFSRIYLGVHYPGDVLFGMMLGTILAFVIWLFGKRYLPINE